MNENEYQMELIKKIENEVLPGSIVLKNDPNFIQGIPDLIVLYLDKYAILEVKKNKKAKYRPNQEWYLSHFGKHVYSETIYPENEEDILDGLQSALQST